MIRDKKRSSVFTVISLFISAQPTHATRHAMSCILHNNTSRLVPHHFHYTIHLNPPPSLIEHHARAFFSEQEYARLITPTHPPFSRLRLFPRYSVFNCDHSQRGKGGDTVHSAGHPLRPIFTSHFYSLLQLNRNPSTPSTPLSFWSATLFSCLNHHLHSYFVRIAYLSPAHQHTYNTAHNTYPSSTWPPPPSSPTAKSSVRAASPVASF